MNSANPADFEAYLRRFPNGVFSELAQNRLSALRGSRVSGAPAGTAIADRRQYGYSAPARNSAPMRRARVKPPGVGVLDGDLRRDPSCYVWNPFPQPRAESVTWTGGMCRRHGPGNGNAYVDLGW